MADHCLVLASPNRSVFCPCSPDKFPEVSESLTGSNVFNLCKISNMMSAFQSFRDHNLCIIVFCLLFLITVDTQRQPFHSTTTASENINSKQSSQSPTYLRVFKKFRRECLRHHSQEYIQNYILENM